MAVLRALALAIVVAAASMKNEEARATRAAMSAVRTMVLVMTAATGEEGGSIREVIAVATAGIWIGSNQMSC